MEVIITIFLIVVMAVCLYIKHKRKPERYEITNIKFKTKNKIK